MSTDDGKSLRDHGEFDINRKIKVLRIIARMNIGGPAVQVTGLVHDLDKEIFEQKLVTGYVDESEADYLIENQIQIEVTRVKGLGRAVNALSDLRAFIALAKVIREFRPDIIHTHTAKAGVLGRTSWVFLGYKPKIVHTFHGHLLHGLLTDRFFAVGTQVMDDLIQTGIGPKHKFQVMPPGLSISSIPDRTLICKKFELDPNKFYCSFLGRVTDIKKPFRFLEIAKYAGEKYPDIHFLLIGAGDLLKECQEKIEMQGLPVTALGWVPQVEEALAVTDLMLLTSENEGMPLSLIQAGMAGIPTISTNVGSVGEVILNNQTGYILDFDVDSFASKIAEIRDNADIRKVLCENAIKYTYANFSTARLAADHKNAYLALFT